MPKVSMIGVRGMWNGPNRLQAPPGSLTFGSEIVIRRQGVAESIRGYSNFGAGTWTPSSDASALYVWNDDAFGLTYLIHRSTTFGHTEDGTTYSNYSGSYTAADARMRFAEAKRCLYFTTSTGVLRLAAYNGTPVLSGVPQPLSITLTSGASTAAAGWLTGPASVAYRATITFEDAKTNFYESAPSSRAVYRLASSTDTVNVRVYIPTGLSTSCKVRIYRSSATTSATDEPSDDVKLVYEAALTSGNISAGYVEVDDIVPDSMRGAYGYFSPNQEGPLQGNYRPPVASDIVWHKRTMFYSNTTSKNRVTCRLLGVTRAWAAATAYVVGDEVTNDSGKRYICDTAGTSAGSGGPTGTGANIADNTAQWDYVAAGTRLTDGDTITIDGTAYTAKNTSGGATEFSIDASTSPQVAIQNTVQNLIATVNAYASNTTVYAYYLSGPDDGAGIFMIEERGLGDSFTVTSSRATCWAPQLGTETSKDDAAKNRIYFSKPDQPEAVPLLNYIDVGSKGDPIARIVPLRDSLYVFKKDEGIFRIFGEPGSFSVREHDGGVRIIGRDTVSKLNNELFCFSEKGFVAVSEVGVRIVSTDIDGLLGSYFVDGAAGTLRAVTHDVAHAIGYEALGLYYAWLPQSLSSPYAMLAYVYCPATDAWTRSAQHFAIASAMPLSGGQRLTVALEGERRLKRENISNSASDYGYAGAGQSPWMQWQVVTADNPAVLKQWTKVDLLIEQTGSHPTSLQMSFSSDLNTSGDFVTSTSVESSPGLTTVVTFPVPLPVQMSTTLTIRLDALNQLSKKLCVLGLVVHYEEAADMAGR